MLEVLLIGGFEPSGHDAHQEALAIEGSRRGHRVEILRWGDRVDYSEHPVFNLHRLAARLGRPWLAHLYDDEELVDAIVEDLRDTYRSVRGAGRFERILTVHPFSAAVAAAEADDVPIIESHGEFTTFPIYADPRVSAFVGGVRPSRSAPEVEARTVVTGVPVRPKFFQSGSGEAGEVLLASCGRLAWASDALLDALPAAVEISAASRVVIATDDPTVLTRAEEVVDGRIVVSAVSRDMYDEELLRSRYVLCKGTGQSVAEAIAARAAPIVYKTGVFWEDEGAEHLASMGHAVPAFADLPVRLLRLWATELLAGHPLYGSCRDAASRIWDVVEQPPAGRPPAALLDIELDQQVMPAAVGRLRALIAGRA